MTREPSGIVLDQPVTETAVAAVDIETTGLQPGAGRVVEISVVRIEPEAERTLVLDTLVNPGRGVAATEIHGITDDDVLDAPRFRDIAAEVARALSGAVLAAYNVYFDVRFLEDEFGRARVGRVPPMSASCTLGRCSGSGRNAA